MNLFKQSTLLILLLFTQILLAQISFKAKVSKQEVPLNESVRIDFSMNADGDNFIAPKFEGFTIIGGPSQSVSTVIINGEVTFNKTYSYYIQAKRKGKITVPAASIEIDGKRHETAPITLTIIDAVQKDNPNQGRNSLQNRSLESIHLVAEISKYSPFINEPVTISYKLYFKDGLTGYRGKNIPTYKKLWVHNVEVPQPTPKETTYKGEPYYYILLKQDVVLAQDLEAITIDPLELTVQAEVMTGRRDFFGFPEYSYIEKDLGSNKITITPKALPLHDQPEDFSGAVGTFDFKVIPNKTSLNAQEQLSLKVEVTGKGNLNLAKIPIPKANSTLEVYDPIYSEKINMGVFGMQGRRTNQYTIIPQYKGEYYIEPMTFSYFDLTSTSYKTITTDSIKINVIEGPDFKNSKKIALEEDSNFENIFQQNAKELSFVTPYISKYWNTYLFYILILLPFIGVTFVIMVKKILDHNGNDQVGRALKQNNKLAKKYLSLAKLNIANKEKFYESLEHCLHNYLKAKLSIETVEMSNENIKELLEQNNITQLTSSAFMQLKKDCEFARYAPTNQENIKKDYQQAIDVIAQIDKQIK